MSNVVFLFILCLVHDVFSNGIYSNFLKHANRPNRHCHAASSTAITILPVEGSKFTLFLVLLSGLVFFLIFLGMIKGLIGLCCCARVGSYGLYLLIDLPRPLSHYQEKQLERRPVIYDIGGWPIHPDTLQKTVRVLPKRTEFCLNLVFFLAYPLAACVYLCALCCCIKNYSQSHDDACFKHVDVVRLTNRGSKQNNNGVHVYKQDYKEDEDTKYVMDAMRKSKESIHQYRTNKKDETCECHSDE
ncbi:uncharacterized protein [Tenebrio molitor]|uniref:uncharacterized protein n=1 Tax=Tenebrio molitor TaxID=7067 RepID=UPI0036246BE1